ncbi:unnamed protein product [Echinostoma caproni]|uniref:ABC2_membrane domain-containing protein n=1 Tax=Echinostoma caproni TaxID=27848 RepID=A0A183AR88_9TREM|nr:unnamed protein product [Echinostoma caproni]
MTDSPDTASSSGTGSATRRIVPKPPPLVDIRRTHLTVAGTSDPHRAIRSATSTESAETVSGSRSDLLRNEYHSNRNKTIRARTVLFWRHYAVLMWKNFILRRRRPGFLVVELLTPIFITCILIILYKRGTEEKNPDCYSQTIGMPSMGVLSFVQSMVCNFAYSCMKTEPPPLTLFSNETGWGNFLADAAMLAKDPWIIKV